MTINSGRQHSAFGRGPWPKFCRRFRLGGASWLGVAALLIAFTSTCSESSAAKDLGSAKGQKTVISFDLYNGNLIIIKATVGSIKNVNFILDTGTSPTALNQTTADLLNVRGTSGVLQTLNGTIQVQTVMLPPIQIGP